MKSIYSLLFILVSTFYIIQINAEKPAICYQGSVHYCKNMQSAKACGKLQYCSLIWDPPAGYKIVKNGDHYNVLNPNIGYIHVG